MVITTVYGASAGYDATTDVAIVTTVNGADVARQEAVVAANDLLLLQLSNLRGNIQDLRGGLR